MHVKSYEGCHSTTSDVGMYLVHNNICCKFLSGDSSKFAVVMAEGGRVIVHSATKRSGWDTARIVPWRWPSIAVTTQLIAHMSYFKSRLRST